MPVALPSASRQTSIVATLVALSAISYVSRTLMSVAGPTIMSQYGLSEAAMGTVYSAFLVGYAGFMIPGGHLVDLLGSRVTLAIVAVAVGALTSFTALAGLSQLGLEVLIWPWLLGARLLLGVCSAPIYPGAARANARWIPIFKRTRVQGWISAGAGIGGVLAPLMLVPFVEAGAWRTPFFLCALAAWALALIWLLVAPREHEQERVSSLAGWRAALSNKTVLVLTAGYFAVCYFEYIFFFWLYYYFGKVRGLSLAETTVATSAAFVAWAVMTPLGGWAADRLIPRLGRIGAKRWVCTIALTAAASLSLAGALVEGAVASIILMAVALGCAAASDGPFWAAVIETNPSKAGAASSFLNTGGNLGGVVSPILTPWLAAWGGWAVSLYFASGIVLSAVIVWFLVDEPADIRGACERG